jgi:hypothetical protein
MKKRILVPLFFILIPILIGFAYAWFEDDEFLNVIIRPGSIEVSIQVYFDDVEVLSNSPYYDSTTKILQINTFDDQAPNYIGKLKITMQVVAHNTSRLRFRLLDEWVLTRYFTNGGITNIIVPYDVVVQGINQSPYTIHPDFFRVSANPYYYFDGFIGKNQTLQFTLVNGGLPYPVRTTDNYYEEVFVHLQVIVDVVQANRIAEKWNVEATIFD